MILLKKDVYCEEEYKIIDTHCHIDLYSNPEEIANRAERNNIKTIAVTNLPSHFKMGYPHLKNHKKVRLALGMHPHMVEGHINELQMFNELVYKTSFIGEVGLDFSNDFIREKERQINSFRYILDTLKDKRKFVTVHSRKAERTVLELLYDYDSSPVVFHWYTGPLSVIEEILEHGHYFSINTAMVKSKSGKEIIRRIPQSRVLTESDGPFIQINRKPAEPHHISMVIDYLANVWGISKLQTEKLIEKNFNNLIYKKLKLR